MYTVRMNDTHYTIHTLHLSSLLIFKEYVLYFGKFFSSPFRTRHKENKEQFLGLFAIDLYQLSFLVFEKCTVKGSKKGIFFLEHLSKVFF